jgi:anti-anti-sigma regulatory factor
VETRSGLYVNITLRIDFTGLVYVGTLHVSVLRNLLCSSLLESRTLFFFGIMAFL